MGCGVSRCSGVDVSRKCHRAQARPPRVSVCCECKAADREGKQTSAASCLLWLRLH